MDPVVRAAEALRAAGRVLLACHVNPDGDTMGSALALGLALQHAGKKVTLVSPDEVPLPYHFLPGSHQFQRSVPEGDYDVAAALDCDGESRMGSAAPAVRRAAQVIEIDHHTGTDRFGDIVVVDPTAAATGELVFGLLRLLALPITADVATNLYVALMTDTGSFRFANTTARCLRIAAELVDCGADPFRIADHVYETRSRAATLLLGRALASLKLSDDGQIAWGRLTAEDFQQAAATDAETEGIVNHLRAIAGVRVAILLREVNGKVRVSLRSREPVDVAAVARVFGGGGHRVAAGCTLPLPLATAERRLLDEARAALHRAPAPGGDGREAPNP
ncbi:MAG: bifunctional oligoribonuclease/PAP phosphatase NrnA [Armatimonadetes bacterium]|nr:bifunctional oligoribonuclease/PAP phosphatase NrnA [Armatimonadota bacterium]